MFTLLKGFPDEVVINSRPLPIEVGWRSHIMLETLDLADHTSQIQALYLMYGDNHTTGDFLALHTQSALQAALEFHRNAYDFYMNYGNETIKSKPSKTRLFDWKDDQSLILADFQAIYGIDLMVYKAHWYQFAQLFRALMFNEKSLVYQAISARSPISAKLKGEERKAALAKRRAWALPLTQTELNDHMLARFES